MLGRVIAVTKKAPLDDQLVMWCREVVGKGGVFERSGISRRGRYNSTGRKRHSCPQLRTRLERR